MKSNDKTKSSTVTRSREKALGNKCRDGKQNCEQPVARGNSRCAIIYEFYGSKGSPDSEKPHDEAAYDKK